MAFRTLSFDTRAAIPTDGFDLSLTGIHTSLREGVDLEGWPPPSHFVWRADC